jgi:hypothetical protein
VSGKILGTAKNSYGKNSYVVTRKSVFAEISEFIALFLQKNPDITFYPESVVQMLTLLKEASADASYGNTVISLNTRTPLLFVPV